MTHQSDLSYLRFRGITKCPTHPCTIPEADSHLNLLPPSILDIRKVFEHIDMLSIGHMVAAYHSDNHTTVELAAQAPQVKAHLQESVNHTYTALLISFVFIHRIKMPYSYSFEQELSNNVWNPLPSPNNAHK